MKVNIESSKNMVIVTHSENYSGKVIIPDYDENNQPVTVIGECAFLNCKGVTEVQLGKNIEIIQDSAFEGCENLKTIILNDRLRSIGKFAFFNCKNLTNLKLKYSVGKIGRSAFQNCESLKNITLHYGISEISPWTFAGCSRLKSIAIPNGVKYIGHQAFADCAMLEKIDTLSSDTSLGYDVFLRVNSDCIITVPLYCDEKYKNEAQWNDFDIKVNEERIFSFNGIRYKEKSPNILMVARNKFFYGHAKIDAKIRFMGHNLIVNSIEDGAFEENDKLESVYIPESIGSIGSGTFAKCTNLQYFTTDNIGDCKFEAKNGVLFSKSGETLVSYPAANDKTVFSIPETVTKIADYAFSSFQYLERITFCNKEVEIGENVFNEAMVGNCVAFVPKDAIALTKKLSGIGFKEIVVSDQIIVEKIIYKILTDGEEGTVEVAKNPDFVGALVVPESIEYAGVKYTVVGVGDNAFNRNNKVTSVSLPNSIKYVGLCAFRGLSSIKMSLPSSLERVAESAFSHNQFDNLNFPPSLKEIDSFAFEYTKVRSKKAHIPASVISIKYNPFNHSSINEIIVDTENSYFKSKDGVLFSKDGQKLLVYPNLMQASTYNIPDGVTTIGSYSFENNSNLIKLVIPASVKKIEDFVLYKLPSKIMRPSLEPRGPKTIKDKLLELNDLEKLEKLKRNKFQMNQGTTLDPKLINNTTIKRTEMGARPRPIIPEIIRPGITNPDDKILHRSLLSNSKIKTIIVQSTTPPEVGNLSLTSVSGDCILIVPKGYVNKYKNAAVWRNFTIRDSDHLFVNKYAKVKGIAYRIVSHDERTAEVSSNRFFLGHAIIENEIKISGEKYKVVQIGKKAFWKNKSLLSVNIPSSIRKICYGSFWNCDNCSNIKVPQGTEIESKAFKVTSYSKE